MQVLLSRQGNQSNGAHGELLASRSSAAMTCIDRAHSSAPHLATPFSLPHMRTVSAPHKKAVLQLQASQKMRTCTVRCVLTLALGHIGAQRAGGPIVVQRAWAVVGDARVAAARQHAVVCSSLVLQVLLLPWLLKR